jgi:GT2 family glycosyltransferase/glycosyltransferase involved in cell wall biosynthesis
VVVVPVFNAHDDVLECLASLKAGTPSDIPILVVDDASTDDRIEATLAPLGRSGKLGYARKPTNSGFVGAVNCAFDWCAPRDVVVVNSDLVVPSGWLERLQAAAYAFSTVATATPLTNNGTLVSVPFRNRPDPRLPNGMTVNQVDARIRTGSLRLRPTIPTAIGHCVYFRRFALDVVGFFDPALAPGYGEEVDFSQRAVNLGLSHVVADDLFVYHKGSRSFDGEDQSARVRLQARHEQMINTRYPWYARWIAQAENDAQSPLARALERARQALLDYRIAIDATKIDGTPTGTQVLTLELIRSLAASKERFARLSMIVNDHALRSVFHGVDGVVDEVVPVSQLPKLEEPFDLVYRPYQIGYAAELALLEKSARRFIVSQLDCIAYSSPIYAASPDEWERYCKLTQQVFDRADGVTFISQAAAQEAAQYGLRVGDERACVTYVGVDHALAPLVTAAPFQASELSGEPFILVLGTNFKHKNRAHAIRMLRALVFGHGWTGNLVFAGPSVASGGSQAEEALVLLDCPELAARVRDVGTVTDAGKQWLLEHAALVLYPSLREGFGMIPFEAAAAGTPTLSSRLASLPEVLGDDVIYLDSFDPEVSANTIWSFLHDPDMARRQVTAIQRRSAAFTWESVADRTWIFCRKVLELPPRQRLAPRGSGVEHQPQESNWAQRTRRGLRILREKGFGGLMEEARQYLRWTQMRRQADEWK